MPLRLQWKKHQEVMKGFKQAMASSSTAIKMDVLAVLRYTEEFLKHYEGARGENTNIFGEAPSDLVSGMQMAFYKNLGQSPAVMNIATINLPRWVKPKSSESLAQMGEALDEHVKVVSSLDESRGEQFELLSRYRDFLSGNDLEPFFEFTAAYSGFIISQRERGKYVRQFTTTALEILMENQQLDLTPIVESQGFQDIAYAIRMSTVESQRRKMKKDRYRVLYEVRYGLGQQLIRKANYRDDFISELTEFLVFYNNENSQILERLNKQYSNNIPEAIRRQCRRSVETTDIKEVIRLMDAYKNPRMIANLLVAFGYAREPFVGKDDEAPDAAEELPEIEGDAAEGDEEEA
jgi:hypothetical protein